MSFESNPFLYSDNNKRYHTFDYYMRKTVGRKCARIPLDGGFTCPNIDGTKGFGGCIYCNLKNSRRKAEALRSQFDCGCAIMDKKWADSAKIVYFNTFSATYAPLARLRELFDEALSFPDVAGIIIGTRADCLPDETVEYVKELNERTFVMVELGLQSVHENTAALINRCHTFDDFLCGYEKLKAAGVRVGVHLINYLPFESREMMLENVETVAALMPDMLKLHQLFVTENTVLYDMYSKGDVYMPSMQEYVSLVCDEIERIPPEICLGRVSGDAPRRELIEPKWTLWKKTVMNEIDKELVGRGTHQGFLCK